MTKCMTGKSAKVVIDTVTVATTGVTGRARGFVVVATRTGIAIETTHAVTVNIDTEKGERDVTFFSNTGTTGRESMHTNKGHERSIASDADLFP